MQDYPAKPSQKATFARHALARRGKPMTPQDEWRVTSAQIKRERRGIAAD